MTKRTDVAPLHAQFDYMQVCSHIARKKRARCIPRELMEIIMEESKSPVVLPHDNFALALAFAPDGKRLAVSTGNDSVLLWDTATWRAPMTVYVTPQHIFNDNVRALSFSSCGTYLAAGSDTGRIRIFNVKKGGLFYCETFHAAVVTGLAFVNEDASLVTACMDGLVKEFDVDTRDYIDGWMRNHAEPIWSLAVSADRETVATVSKAGMIRLWEANEGVTSERIDVMADACNVAAFSSVGSLLAFNDYEEISLYDLQGKVVKRTIGHHSEEVRGLQFSPSGRHLASASEDKTACIFDVETGASLVTFTAHKREVWSVAYSPDGNVLATSSFDKSVRLWDTRSGQAVKMWSPLGNINDT